MSDKISIIIPYYNANGKIQKCLDSILAQNYKDYEVLIVDDCSSDNIKWNSLQANIKVIRLDQRRGPGYARNIGARNAVAEKLFFIDSDVILPKGALDLINESYRIHHDISGVVGLYSENLPYGNFTSVYKNLMVCFEDRNRKDFTYGFRSYAFSMWKRDFLDIGGFDESLGLLPCEDFEFSMRLEKKRLKFYLNRKLEVVHDKQFKFYGLIKQDFQRVRAFYYLSKKFKYFKIPARTIPRHYIVSRTNLFIPLSLIISLLLILYNDNFAYLSLFIIIGYLGLNIELIGYLMRLKGLRFTLASLGLFLLEMFVSEFAIAAQLFNKGKM